MRKYVRAGLLASISAIFLLACGGAQSGGSKADATIESLFPMADGNVWNFAVRVDGDASPTLANVRVNAAGPGEFEVRPLGGQPVRYRVEDGGVKRLGDGSWLFQGDVRVGAKWMSQHGASAEIVEAHAELEIPAGNVKDCYRVRESGGRSGILVNTTYCAGVGPVIIESSMKARSTGMSIHSRAELVGCAMKNPVSPCIAPDDL